MRYIEYGAHEAQISEVVLGLMRIWDKTPDQVYELIDTALAHGINALDTAPVYGPSEGKIGEVFAAHPGLRDRVWLQTKLGIRPHPRLDCNYFDFSYEHIMESVDASLAALKTDRIDSLLLHRPDVLMDPSEVARAFNELYDQGKVVEFGVSNQNVAQESLLQNFLDFPLAANQVQLSCAFTPAFDHAFNVNTRDEAGISRDGGIFEYALLHDQAIQAWSVMQKGYFTGPFLGAEEYADMNAVLARIGEEHGVTDMAVAIAWVLRHPAKMQAIIGTTNPTRVAQSAAACDFELTREEWYEIYLAGGRRLP